jgi:hypothetical protein
MRLQSILVIFRATSSQSTTALLKQKKSLVSENIGEMDSNCVLEQVTAKTQIASATSTTPQKGVVANACL